MSDKELLKREIEKIPEHKIQEVIDFVQFLLEKEKEQMNISLVSEPSLKKDWEKPEEDKAWKHL
ncbi:DUF2281 domain-containing protein [Gracilimonas sp.]|uniref:DUF2281 domain-containing protein n=1 Tax=Gracilimonas sp. TaxID=1974203 RepID=UPI0028712B4C|nr:DUF2281 domain-containing protein [Gracilimonas sp.]